MVALGKRYEPNMKNHELYSKLYNAYCSGL